MRVTMGTFEQDQGARPVTQKLTNFDMAGLLDSDEAIKEYLYQVLTDGDDEEFSRAVEYIIRAYVVRLETT
jgi:DNA-binding phage protein